MAIRTPQGYLAELLDAREKLRDFVDHLVNRGKTSYFKDIALKLRVIYLDKSGTKALLKAVLEHHQLKVHVFVTRSMEERIADGKLSPKLAEGVTFSFHNTMANWFYGGHFMLDPFSAITRPDLLLAGERISLKSVIETIADKQSAHIDPRFPDAHLALQGDEILFGELPIATRVLVDAARTTIQLIDYVEQAITHGIYSRYVQKIA